MSSTAQRQALRDIEQGEKHGPAEHVTAAYGRLQGLTHEPVAELRADPTLSEGKAVQLDGHAATLDSWAAGGSAEGVSEDEAAALGWELFNLLAGRGGPQNLESEVIRVMLGRAPVGEEEQRLADPNWEVEPGELPGLLDYARKHWGKLAPLTLRILAQRERKQAQAIREAQREAEHAQVDALALAALPDVKELEKVTRYEAHLERVLYRALHDLEAACREGEGKETPGPLRGVLDVDSGNG